ncbi:hypothetical protein BU25DRAFT_479271 [Macroventuria anomochaeta]|uniref:Uncharacterized protein n=1 Tax=Macroventuria anomochaeta TaxID=301207 RepID=A0ACB6SCG8_9PLEO|nr:uncharacterized protein BU25DRAFT_479271 [Macroventuria anomochaeta]KAF2631682.1 hypothetical protein BU25DRAFT_479271 [Macroventuria anomochaeta]
MADPTYRAAQPGEFFCPAGGKWYVERTGSEARQTYKPQWSSRFSNLKDQVLTFSGICAKQGPNSGCCNEDPCMNNSTCPEGKLEPTYWDRPDQYEYFKHLNILLSSTAPQSTSTLLPTGFSSSSSGSKSLGAVIGGAVGVTLGFLVIVAAVVLLLWRRKRRNRKQDLSRPSMRENKPEAGELASPVSAGTVPPTYSWDVNGNPPVQQRWAHNHSEVSGEDSKDSPRSLYTELHSESSLARIAELPGATAARELDTPDITPKPLQTSFEDDMAKQSHGLDIVTNAEEESRKSAGKR